MEESKSEGLDGSGDCECLEVTTVVHGSNTWVDERVVGGFMTERLDKKKAWRRIKFD